MDAPSPTLDAKSEFYPPYAEFSKTLRTWFVAYGIGGPVVLLANEKAWPIIVASGLSFDIGLLFLIGGGVQVISALVNKHTMWHLFFCEESPTVNESERKAKHHHKSRWIYQIASWYSYQNWIDELLDFFTLVLFAWATALAFRILSPPVGKVIIRDKANSCLVWTLGIIISGLITIVWGRISARKPSESAVVRDTTGNIENPD